MDHTAGGDGYLTTPMHEQLREHVRQFAEDEVGPRVEEMERSRAVHHELSRLIAAQGWLGVTIGREYGGMGLGHLAKTIIIEELSRVSGAMGAMVQASQLGVAKILHFGDDRQRQRWLPAVADGSCLPTIATTEPHSGGDVLGMTSTATPDGDGYVLNGTKVFVGNSHIGDLHGVIVRTGPGSRGLSAFLVEADRPGLSLVEHRPAMGLHGFSFGELRFDNCRVPRENLLGKEGDGLAVAYSSSVTYGRLNLAAVSLGLHQALVDDTAEFAAHRPRRDGHLSDLPTIKKTLGQMKHRLMSCRLAAYHASHMLDLGLTCDDELMLAKVENYERSRETATQAMEVHAAHGLTAGTRVERNFRDVHHIYAPAGTSDVQWLRLAEALLGEAKTPWSQQLAPLLRTTLPDHAVVGESVP